MADMNNEEKQRDNKGKELTYNDYIKVEKLLSCQNPIECGKPAHDQLLFIVTHQVHELWFKQIIFELDSIRDFFMNMYLDENKMLVLNNRLNRIIAIFKILTQTVSVLETMTALDFMEFREFLVPSSGNQSLQFRLIENKWGVKEENRVKYNQQNYRCPMSSGDLPAIDQSVKEPSLAVLLQKWLERTPGLEKEEFDFGEKYKSAVEKYLFNRCEEIAQKENLSLSEAAQTETVTKLKKTFETVIDQEKYSFLFSRGERSFSYRAFQGAMMIALYRDEPRFSQPFQMLNLIMDIESLMTVWKHNHSILVQRLVGSKVGTGGSSGYQYLRSTVSDRYKPFLDLFNLATYLVPREFIPPLSEDMKERLNRMNF